MEQGQYISINREVYGNTIYPSLTYHHGNYIFDGQIYSIWKFTKKENEEQTYLFSHPDNKLYDECAIYFTLSTEILNNAEIVFIDRFTCDIGPGIGRKMLEAFLNYLLDMSDKKINEHKFTEHTYICLIPGKIVDSNRLRNDITFGKDRLIGYYNSLGFRMNADTSQLCGPIYWLLYSIQKVHNKRTGSSISKYKIQNPALKAAQRYRALNHKAQKTGYVPVTKSQSKPKQGGRKKQMTRKKRK